MYDIHIQYTSAVGGKKRLCKRDEEIAISLKSADPNGVAGSFLSGVKDGGLAV
jgi:hypothetical protein